MRDRLILTNPARSKSRKGDGIKLPRKTRKRNVYLTHHGVDLFAEAAGKNGDLALLMAYSGARWGEATALKRRDFDLGRRRVLIDENAVEVGKEIIVGTTKGHKRRTVPIVDFLIPASSNACAACGLPVSSSRVRTATIRRPHNVSGWFDMAVAKAARFRESPRTIFGTPRPVSRWQPEPT